MTSIQVDPQRVIKRLVEENSRLVQDKVFLEVAYETLQEEHDKVTRENRQLKAKHPESPESSEE